MKKRRDDKLIYAVQNTCAALGWECRLGQQDGDLYVGQAWLSNKDGRTRAAVSIRIDVNSGELVIEPIFDGIDNNPVWRGVAWAESDLFIVDLRAEVRRYMNDPDAGLTPQRRKRNQIIRELRAQNFTISQIAEADGVDCSEETVERVLGLRK